MISRVLLRLSVLKVGVVDVLHVMVLPLLINIILFIVGYPLLSLGKSSIL